ncbi:MAG: DUF502 domain-containing protein [Gemmatimonadota bacterium]|nr:DUF502 domain-containing protein [Gemmatimonadota bacterium]
MRRALQRFRRYLVTGLVVAAPAGVTAYVLVWLFQRVDPILGRYLPAIGLRRIPGLGVLALVAILVLVGWASQRAAGRRLLHWWNILLSRLPVARRIYSATGQIAEAVLDREEKIFRCCALVEFPAPGSWALVFETAMAPPAVHAVVGEPAVSVFLPTSPNPTSGYLLLVPRSRVHRIAMTVEDGLKMVLSAGVAVPGAVAVEPVSGDGAVPGGEPPAGASREGGRA